MNSLSAAILTVLLCILTGGEAGEAVETVDTTIVQHGHFAECTIDYTVTGFGNTMDYHFSIPAPPTPSPSAITEETFSEQNAQQLEAQLRVCTKFSGSGLAICTGTIKDAAGNVLATQTKTLPIMCAVAHRDPKFLGFDGEMFYVKGEDGHNYAIISDQHLQLNALFDRHGLYYQHQTYMKQIGLVLGDRYHITLNVNGTITVNEVEYSCQNINLQTDQLKITCESENDRVFTYAVTVADYEFLFSSKLNGIMINLNVAYVPKTINYGPHGILGQTADKDHVARQGLSGSQQGEGILEGTYKDYEVSHIFSSDFKFSRFKALNRNI